MVDRRKDPNYEQVTGHVQRDLARRFKVFCTDKRITIADALDKAIALFLQQAEGEAKDPEPKAHNKPPVSDTSGGAKSRGKKGVKSE